MEQRKFLPEISDYQPAINSEDMTAFRAFLEEIQEKLKNAPPPRHRKPKRRTKRKKKPSNERYLFPSHEEGTEPA